MSERQIANEEQTPPPYDDAPGNNGVRPFERPRRAPGRVAPHNLEAEESLLGAMLLSRHAIDAVISTGITAADFYRPAHAHIYAAAAQAHAAGDPVDPVIVSDALQKLGLLDMVGGPAALVGISMRTPAISSAAAYARIVIDSARLRRLIGVAGEIAEIGYGLPGDVDDAINRAALLIADTGLTAAGPDEDTTLPVDLEAVLAGSEAQPIPTLLHRDDGQALFYAGAVNGIHGDSGSGKGWVICLLIMANARRGARTMLVDLEDTAESITARLLALGMTVDEIIRWLIYIRPQEPLTANVVAAWCKLADDRSVQAIVIDSIGEAFALEGIDENKDVEVGPWIRRVARPLADTGAGVILVDHSTKANDNPLHPSGSKRKRAAITGASYLAESTTPFVKGHGGRLRLTCAKDRHGNYRRGEAAANLVMNGSADNIDLRLYAPTPSAVDATVPTVLAARAAVTAAKKAGRPVSRNELEGLMSLKVRAEVKRGGIDHAIAEGALSQHKDGRALIVTYLSDLEETA